jgi:hypothetical protein
VRRSRETVISQANRAISVFDVLAEFFDRHPPRTGRSYKSRCPFSWEHYDGGVDKGFRTYPSTNTAYCFVQHGSLGPVRLIQLRNGWTAERSARWLLDHYNLLTDKPWQERWKDLMEERDDELGSPAVLVEALHTALSEHPNYPTSGLSPVFAAAMEEHLAKLDALYGEESEATDSDVRVWYMAAKEQLGRTLDEQGADARA